jgi:Mn2+/Fe2+ NRAMP family transporter
MNDQSEVKLQDNQGAAVPTSIAGYLKALGPGIIYIMGLFAVGDMTVAAKGGSDFGYSFLWATTLGTLAIVALSMPLARYQMATGEGCFRAYRRVNKILGLGCTIALIVMPLNWHGYMWIATGQASAGIFQIATNGTVVDARIFIFLFWAIGLYPVYSRRYDLIEKIAKTLLAVLFLVVLYCAVYTQPNMGEVVKGALIPTYTPEMTPIILACFGASAAAIICWNYGYTTKEKGWTGKRHKKVMYFDIISAGVIMMVIATMLTIVSTEVLHKAGITAYTATDMASSIGLILGNGGYVAYFVGMFAAAYSSIIAYSWIMTHMILDSLGIDTGSETGLKWYRRIALFLYTAPILWSFIPSLLSLVGFTIFVNVISNLFVIIPLILTLYVGNSKKFATDLDAFKFYRIRKWENIVLAVFFIMIIIIFTLFIKGLIG